ncbi:MAG: hypothetical protein AB1941_28620 [Gemmatimonadota bacterium]
MRSSCMLKRAAALCSLLAAHLLASPAGAQLRGAVVDSVGKPVVGVTVEVWSPYHRLAAVASDGAGTFRFTVEETQGVGGIFARRAGWKTAYQGIPWGDTLVVVRMEPAPSVLPGLTVRAAPVPCARRDSPGARELWAALRDRYRGGTDTTTVIMHFDRAVSIGPRDSAAVVDPARAARGWIRNSAVDRRVNRHLINAGGYALSIHESMDEAYAGWKYPPLESQYPTHFVEDDFGEQHVFALASLAAGMTVLRFCPRERSKRRPQIEGSLTLAADGTLLRAAWSYLTPGPRQDAGAEVEFAASQRVAPLLLLPATSTYWRRTTGGKFYRQRDTYTAWRVAPEDVVLDMTERPRP